MLVKGIRFSYEGEGDLIGTKTLFCRTPGDRPLRGDELGRVGQVYINAELISKDLRLWVQAHRELPVTIEIAQEGFLSSTGAPLPEHVRLFVTCDRFTADLPPFKGFVKVRVLVQDAYSACVRLANLYAEAGHAVLLMPELPVSPQEAGEQMLQMFDHLHPGVRLMPPAQRLLEID
jgi:hypothetical protein